MLLSTIFAALFLLFGATLMLYGLVQSAVNVYDIDHGTLSTYTGPYDYRVKVSHGKHFSVTYIFTLGNGDVVLASKREITNPDQLEQHDELSFQYTTVYSNPLYRRYSAVSILSANGETEFVDTADSRRESVGNIWLSSIFSVLLLLLLLALLLFTFPQKNRKKNSRHRKKHNQK